MKFLLLALFAAVVCSANAETDNLLGHIKELKELRQNAHKLALDKIKCHINAITESVKGTDLEQKWKSVHEELVVLKENIVKCVQDNKSPLDAAKCVAKEAHKIHSIIQEFVEHLKNDYTDIYNKIKEAIKKC